MAYGFPATYQPYYQYQQPQNGIIWVQGEAGAKSYLVAPNSTVQLWDSEQQSIYLKSADASGMPSMKVLDYTIRANNAGSPANPLPPKDNQTINFATKSDLEAVYTQLRTIQEDVNKMKEAKHE